MDVKIRAFDGIAKLLNLEVDEWDEEAADTTAAPQLLLLGYHPEKWVILRQKGKM